MKTIILPRRETLAAAARSIAVLLDEKPQAVLAVSSGDDCLELYDVLASLCAEGQLDLSQARLFALTEFEGLSADDARSCRARLQNRLVGPCAVPASQVRFLSENDLERYDDEIAAAGGLDLAIVGIGLNGRFGFNEPATPYDSLTHRQKLTHKSRLELAPLFGGEEQVPAFGLTAGVKTVVEAKKILVLALGGDRADAVYKMLYARTDSFVPAAFLQLPLQVDVYLDKSAAEKL